MTPTSMSQSDTWLYHITPLANLSSILTAGELRAKRALDQEDRGYTSIAHQTIQQQREHTRVPCGPGGVLHDYVPFYFGPRAPMLYSIANGHVEGYAQGQEEILHLVTTAEDIQRAGLGFVFSDGHAIMALTEFFTDLADLSMVDMALMKERYWHDSDDDPDRKRRRQAEFLVHGALPLNLLRGIAVISADMQQRTQSLLAAHGVQLAVKTARDWYY